MSKPRRLRCASHGETEWDGQAMCSCGHLVHMGRDERTPDDRCPKCRADLMTTLLPVCAGCFAAKEAQQEHGPS